MKKQVFFWAIAISLSFIACSRNHTDHNPAANSGSSPFPWLYILIFVATICIIFKRKKLKKLLNKLCSKCRLLWRYDRRQEDDMSNLTKELENFKKELKKDVYDLKKELRNEVASLKEVVEQEEHMPQLVKKLQSENQALKTENQALKAEKDELFEENIRLGEKVDNLKASQTYKKKKENDETLSVSIKQVSQQTNSHITTLFADSIIDDYLVKIRETANEDSTFVLHLNGENSANFSVYKPAYQRVMANPSFLEGCEKQILGNTMQLEITSEGKAQRVDSNNKWKVISKLNVIIR